MVLTDYKSKVEKIHSFIRIVPSAIPTQFREKKDIFLRGYEDGWNEYKEEAIKRMSDRESDIVMIANLFVPFKVKHDTAYQSGFIYGWGNFRIQFKRAFYT